MPTNLEQLKEQGEKEYWLKFNDRIGRSFECYDAEQLLKDFLNWHNSQIDLAYQAGRVSILKEMNHEQAKLSDGFNHPKDCEMCKLFNL